jgi:hypothetical protein
MDGYAHREVVVRYREQECRLPSLLHRREENAFRTLMVSAPVAGREPCNYNSFLFISILPGSARISKNSGFITTLIRMVSRHQPQPNLSDLISSSRTELNAVK